MPAPIPDLSRDQNMRPSQASKRKRQRPWGLWRFILEELAVSKSVAASSGYRQADLRSAPGINLSALLSNLHATCAACRSPALPSNSTTNSRRPSNPSTCLQINLQLALATNLSGPPSGQPSTCVSSQPSSPAFASTRDLRRLPILEPAFRSISSLRLRSIFQLHLPADFQLAPSFNLPVPPSNLTSDSHRPLIPSALPSANLRLALPINFPALPDEPNVRLRMSHLRLCFPANLRLASSTSLSALPSNSTSDSSTTASLRRCLPVNLQLSLPTNLPARPDGPNLRLLGVASVAPLPANL